MYMVKQGTVELYIMTSEYDKKKKFKNDGRPKLKNKKYILSILGKGEILGEEEVINNLPR